MKKDPKIFILHILESIKDIEDFTKGMTKERFSKDKKTQSAVIRKIEIIGEATKNLPADFKRRFKNIEWKKATGMRDKLIHEYFGVNLNIVWQTAKKNLPMFKKQITEILEWLE